MEISTSIWDINHLPSDYKEKLIKLKNAGFTGVDFDFSDSWVRSKFWLGEICPNDNVFLHSFEEIDSKYQPLFDALESAGLGIAQAHAPFPPGVADRPYTIDYAVKTIQGCVAYCAKKGIKYVVVHGHSLFDWDKGHTLEDIHKMNMDLYKSFIPLVMGSNTIVCLENMFTPYNATPTKGHATNAYEVCRDIDELNALCNGEEHFGYCIDTGHYNIVNSDCERFIRLIGKRLKCTHINDNFGTAHDSHTLPYFGRSDIKAFLRGFKAIGYQGPVNFETLVWTKKPTPVSDAMIKFMGETGKYFVRAIKGDSPID